ncbi:hypothetical protein [Novosphingobium olei]|uniref:hypothetical protein n=1 Tax=Novosphingobium olei TaxID=2728851 RepID=UPI0030893B95|nr:hypothetical protein NSDW_33080 [Novosphingobium olei]
MARRDAGIEAMEDTLLEAWELLMRSPDQERGWLASGARSAWPAIIRDKIMDYADEEARPRQQLNRREVRLRDRVWVDDDCLSMEIAPDNRPLVAVVLAMKARPGAGGFRWERVWEVLGGRESGLTTDTIRMRYERTLRRLAAIEAENSGVEF